MVVRDTPVKPSADYPKCRHKLYRFFPNQYFLPATGRLERNDADSIVSGSCFISRTGSQPEINILVQKLRPAHVVRTIAGEVQSDHPVEDVQ